MKTDTQRRLEAVEKQLGELTAAKECSTRRSEVWELEDTIARESWWDSLSPEQYQAALDHMRKANQLLAARLGLHMRLVTVSREW